MQGKVGEPSNATLRKLANHFNVTVAWLRGKDETILSTIAELVLNGKIPEKDISEISKMTYSGIDAVSFYLKRSYESNIEELAEALYVSVDVLSGNQTLFNMFHFTYICQKCGTVSSIKYDEFIVDSDKVAMSYQVERCPVCNPKLHRKINVAANKKATD